ncbi:NAD-dependent epimerase/dehydratase family protein [Micromonospora sp. WMMD1120]|uniref:NAD-dependent epimerase/dehydratase family protein n=1 Tax=Micromonospora sp. WMMD1120 TaxID=3016106 RepID=UPI0024164C4C|nr:NAD-dependent epimerase/dehydratase family protein [Micromonospora sp. WMMD1120]MDG4805846.1 NAD-dependent epimerase/dehydratase family protein [Micromonospora sp. WMMD1120]
MRILILGGTQFFGRALARLAVAQGHEVTCAARGVSGVAPAGVRFVPVDRDDPDALRPLADTGFDAVVDVTRQINHARHALAVLADRVAHWSFVSTISVYADHATPGLSTSNTPLLPPAAPDVDGPGPDFSGYGECKVSIEEMVRDRVGEDRSFICRAGLLVGPEDSSGRFPYWVRRLAAGGEVLAPGAPTDRVQFVDAEDLAGWLLHAAAVRLGGTYDGTGPTMSRAEMLAGVAAGLGVAEPLLTWVDQDFLTAHDVREWWGERALPLWVRLPESAGLMDRDVSAAVAAGLVIRPLPDTVRATASWMTAHPDAVRQGGLDPADEAEILRKWHAVRDR